MKQMIACVLMAAVLLGLIRMVKLYPEVMLNDFLCMDDPEVAATIDQEALYRELFDPDSVVNVSVNMTREQVSNIQRDYDYYR